jgi:hypothetical protein
LKDWGCFPLLEVVDGFWIDDVSDLAYCYLDLMEALGLERTLEWRG